MRLFLTLIALIIVVALAAPFVLKRPDGLPWMDASELSPEIEVNGSYENAKLELYRWWHGLRRDLLGDTQSGKTKAYRWQDSAGNWHLSDSPNPAGAAEELWVDPNANLMQSVPVPEPTEEAENTTQADAKAVPLPMTVSPGQAQKLMQDAQQIQELVDKRYQEIDAQTNKRSQ
ncbi:hypothetical protein [uncultured Pseudoteredinibacter sp.]|uniref:hypothetical protein n=1 Tax=uncultured Pseudoteredinibacter sp. TaxID=1641701 RepID=UPI00262A26B9|nr:hypothetical protein [uncultured Pseudoteredinibacter sp.]